MARDTHLSFNLLMHPTQSVTVDGARLAYVVAGPPDSDPVVLLHGYVGSRRTWRHQLEPLASRYRVYALDWFGWGDSDRDPNMAYDYETEIARLGRVLDALGLRSTTLVGHDYGGLLSLGFTIAHPERVSRLGIVNSRAHGTFNRRWQLAFGLIGTLCQHSAGRALLRLLPLGGIFRQSMAPLVRRGYLDEAALDHYVGWMDRDPKGRAYLARFHQDYRVAPRTILAASLDSIRCPAAVCWGARDAYLPTRIATELAGSILDCELKLLPHAGHFLPDECPDAVTEAITRLMSRDVVGPG